MPRVYYVQDEATKMFYHRVGGSKTWVQIEKATPLTKQGAVSVLSLVKRERRAKSPVVRVYDAVPMRTLSEEEIEDCNEQTPT